MFNVGQYVCVKEPIYPELAGIAKISKIFGTNGLAVMIEFSSDNSKFKCATRLLRAATEVEIQKLLSKGGH